MNLHDQIIGSQESSVFLLIICVEETAPWVLIAKVDMTSLAMTMDLAITACDLFALKTRSAVV